MLLRHLLGLELDYRAWPRGVSRALGVSTSVPRARRPDRRGLRGVRSTSRIVRGRTRRPSTSDANDDRRSGVGRESTARRPPKHPGLEILAELGRGGMGVVYKARQIRLNRLVALKMILPGDTHDADVRDRFRAEAEAVARLSTPTSCRSTTSASTTAGRTSRWNSSTAAASPGGSTARPGQPEPAARLVETLARAIEDAHRQGIIHRDLKPANILLTADGQPQGHRLRPGQVARRRRPSLTHTGALLGTPSYMAPEQAEAGTEHVGPAADVYAPGRDPLRAADGPAAVPRATPLETLELVRSRGAGPAARLQPGLPRDLETICLKCLEKEPGKRYATAAELADDLGRFLDHDRSWPARWGRSAGWHGGAGGTRSRPGCSAPWW